MFKANKQLFSISIALTTVFSLSSTMPALCLTENKGALKGKVSASDTVSAEEGVKLIEQIFHNVKGSSQIALNSDLNKSLSEASIQTKAIPTQASSTDFKLAIRPKEAGKNALAQPPALNMFSVQSNAAPSEPTVGKAEKEDAVSVENWQGSQMLKAKAQTPKIVTDDIADHSIGVWEKKAALAQTAPPVPAAAPAPNELALGGLRKDNQITLQRQLADERSEEKDRSKPTDKVSISAPLPLGLNTPIKIGAGAGAINGDGEQRRDVVAMLPPHVVTGIPIISLGISEAQAQSALQPTGKLSKQNVEGWTVISWTKNGSSKTSMQLYVRDGLLYAMRIFDGSLIAKEFGLNLGDNLSSVKEHFGEPAFIIAEPEPGTGQNYIYPISQVGFQLGYNKTKTAPEVISLVIFNVK